MNELTLDIWSDVACPWCWIGKRRLDQALFKFDGDVTLRWHAFELNPYAPGEAPEKVDYAKRLAEKYDTDIDEAQEMIDRMVESGRQAGVEMNFDCIRPSNTFDAHRLIAWAQRAGFASEMKDRLFKAYLQEGRAISDRDVLAELAGDVGLDAGKAAEMLASEEFSEDVRDGERNAAQLEISGVPFFVIGGKVAVSGAQSSGFLLRAFEKAAGR